MKYTISKTTQDSIIFSHPDKSPKVIIKRKNIEEEILPVIEKVSEDTISECVKIENNPLEKDDTSDNVEGITKEDE